MLSYVPNIPNAIIMVITVNFDSQTETTIKSIKNYYYLI